MSSEVSKYSDISIKEKEKPIYAEVINFPNENKSWEINEKKINYKGYWKLYDKSYLDEDGDQLKTIVAICFMFSVLLLLGLYSSLL